MSEAIKASGDEGVKRKFSNLFQRLDGVATIDGRSFEAVLMDPGTQFNRKSLGLSIRFKIGLILSHF